MEGALFIKRSAKGYSFRGKNKKLLILMITIVKIKDAQYVCLESLKSCFLP